MSTSDLQAQRDRLTYSRSHSREGVQLGFKSSDSEWGSGPLFLNPRVYWGRKTYCEAKGVSHTRTTILVTLKA